MTFSYSISGISEEISKRINGKSYRPNPHIGLSELAYLRLGYIDFDGAEQMGELICDRRLAEEVAEIFRELFEAGYRIEKLRLADEYGGDDEKIMSDNNSSCFNYRTVEGTNTISLHGYGRAIDINPLYNPYIVDGRVMPANAVEYADRSRDFAHKIAEGDICLKIFRAHGWKWGGDWQQSKDYQHFYKSPTSRSPIARLRRIFG